MSAPPFGAPCWIKIPVRDIAALKSPSTADYSEVKAALFSFKSPKGLSGGIVQLPKECPPSSESLGSGFTVYFLVDSIEKASDRIHGLSGQTVLPKMSEAKNGWFANSVDPEGNRFGIYEVNPERPIANAPPA